MVDRNTACERNKIHVPLMHDVVQDGAVQEVIRERCWWYMDFDIQQFFVQSRWRNAIIKAKRWNSVSFMCLSSLNSAVRSASLHEYLSMSNRSSVKIAHSVNAGSRDCSPFAVRNASSAGEHGVTRGWKSQALHFIVNDMASAYVTRDEYGAHAESGNIKRHLHRMKSCMMGN